MNERGRLHVVLGTGPLGLAVSRHLAARGERVRAVSRSGRADLSGDVEVLAANVADVAEVTRACAGAAVVYHCANPPYARWPELHPPLMEVVIGGAASAGATLVFGDNMYAYGPVDGSLTEELPYRATGPNGRTRARIAQDLMSAHRDGRVRAAIGRASDCRSHVNRRDGHSLPARRRPTVPRRPHLHSVIGSVGDVIALIQSEEGGRAD